MAALLMLTKATSADLRVLLTAVTGEIHSNIQGGLDPEL